MKKVIFSALVALVAVTGAFASVNGLRATTVYGTFNASAACPTDVSIACNTSLVNNPVCTNSSDENLYTNDPETGKCTRPLFID